ncbi:chromatin/chromatin-binding, or -regulatory protein [Lithospermum erythrorhizon]|uniref:Chromatin/chromatin-binding, or -regulatory protein n=1 Tax=Lithospermum erythrorhizon TaxID=34254 RepID=A0AAV3RLE1_LITER
MELNPPITIKEKDDKNDNIGSSEADKTNGIKEEPTNINISSTVSNDPENANQNPIDVESSEGERDQSPQQDDQHHENANNQIVLYDGPVCGGEIVPVPDPEQTLLPPRFSTRFPDRILPAVGAFTIQCANCFKWRLIPTKEKYEQIREHILENPFYCETAREWRPEISCDDPTDISQDGSRLWAIDKPNIALPPPGWQRLLRIRAEGGTKFADVYYQAPSGKRFRSMVEVEKYLSENPRYVEEGVRLSQFSFQIPRPLQENYVRKRPARPALLHDGNGSGASGFAEPSEVNPIAWVGPDEDTEFHDRKLSDANGGASLAELCSEPKRRKA